MSEEFIRGLVSHLPLHEQKIKTLIYYIYLVPNNDYEAYFERYSQAIIELDNLLVTLSDDEINRYFIDIFHGISQLDLPREDLKTKMLNMFEILFIHYINYLSIDTIKEIINSFEILINAVIDYRPNVAHEIFTR